MQVIVGECLSFQSYFIQDYRWKNQNATLTAQADKRFNPTSFRITVGSLHSGWGVSQPPSVSILLHSGLPLEVRVIPPCTW